jgi:hypothetical protein
MKRVNYEKLKSKRKTLAIATCSDKLTTLKTAIRIILAIDHTSMIDVISHVGPSFSYFLFFINVRPVGLENLTRYPRVSPCKQEFNGALTQSQK